MNNLDEDIKIVEGIASYNSQSDEKEIYEGAQSIKRVLSELETYKKIAEKLAEILIYLPLGEDQKQFFTKEAVIDWAKREVANDKQS